MTPDQFERLGLASDSTDEVLAHIEKLLKTLRIEVPNKHYPVRRALFWFDAEGSDSGDYIPFSVYRDAIDAVLKDEDELLDKLGKFEADPDNDGFASLLGADMEDGMSEDDAIKSITGAANMDMLAKGMIPGFINLIESIAPDLGGLEGLKEQSDPMQDFMDAGIPGPAGLVVGPVKERIENIAKSALGIQHAKRREEEKSAQKIINYVVGVAMSKTGDYSPARIWHAWAMYSQLRRVKHEIGAIRQDAVLTSGPGSINIGESDIHALDELNLERMYSSIRYAAVIFSHVLSNALLCCIIAALIELPDLKIILDGFETILSVGININLLNLRFNVPNYADLTNSLLRLTASRISARLDAQFEVIVKFMRDSFDILKERLGSEDLVRCLMLDKLFDNMIGIMRGLKQSGAQRLRLLLDQLKLEGQDTIGINLGMMDNIQLSQTLGILQEIKRLAESLALCGLGSKGTSRRGLDLVDRIRNEQDGFHVHIRGTPMPEGLDPRSPLANLDPIATAHSVINPGIQGNDLPTGELEELFEQCRAGQLGSLENVTILEALVKRK